MYENGPMSVSQSQIHSKRSSFTFVMCCGYVRAYLVQPLNSLFLTVNNKKKGLAAAAAADLPVSYGCTKNELKLALAPK